MGIPSPTQPSRPAMRLGMRGAAPPTMCAQFPILLKYWLTAPRCAVSMQARTMATTTYDFSKTRLGCVLGQRRFVRVGRLSAIRMRACKHMLYTCDARNSPGVDDAVRLPDRCLVASSIALSRPGCLELVSLETVETVGEEVAAFHARRRLSRRRDVALSQELDCTRRPKPHSPGAHVVVVHFTWEPQGTFFRRLSRSHPYPISSACATQLARAYCRDHRAAGVVASALRFHHHSSTLVRPSLLLSLPCQSLGQTRLHMRTDIPRREREAGARPSACRTLRMSGSARSAARGRPFGPQPAAQSLVRTSSPLLLNCRAPGGLVSLVRPPSSIPPDTTTLPPTDGQACLHGMSPSGKQVLSTTSPPSTLHTHSESRNRVRHRPSLQRTSSLATHCRPTASSPFGRCQEVRPTSPWALFCHLCPRTTRFKWSLFLFAHAIGGENLGWITRSERRGVRDLGYRECHRSIGVPVSYTCLRAHGGRDVTRRDATRWSRDRIASQLRRRPIRSKCALKTCRGHQCCSYKRPCHTTTFRDAAAM